MPPALRRVLRRWPLAAGVLALVLAGCDSRPTASPGTPPEKTAAAAPQGELIQPLTPTPAPQPTPVTPTPAPVASTPAATPAPVATAAPTATAAPVPTAAPTPVATAAPIATPATIVSTSNAVPVDAAPVKTADGFANVGFDKLSAFAFDVSDEILQADSTNAVAVAKKTAEQIPQAVRDFDQQRIALKGFMLPLKVEGGKVTELLIMRDQSMCCYGAVPKINEWVSVKMVGGGVKPVMDQAITLYGKLFVGEMRENGYLVGIYRMDGERVEGPSGN